MRKRAKKKRWMRFLGIGFITLSFFSLTMLLKIVSEYKTGEDSYKELQDQAVSSQPTPLAEEAAREQTPWPQVDFQSLQKINPDVAAWIYCEGTPISYPVVQGQDNEYYLNHLFDGAQNAAGTIFIDSRNQKDFSDSNTIIYGHNRKDKSMFWSLEGYQSQEFYDSHPVMYLITEKKQYEMQIFSGYTAKPEETAEPWITSFATAEEYGNWLHLTKKQSSFFSAVQPEVTDKVVTLSTCVNDSWDVRFVVVGRLAEVEK